MLSPVRENTTILHFLGRKADQNNSFIRVQYVELLLSELILFPLLSLIFLSPLQPEEYGQEAMEGQGEGMLEPEGETYDESQQVNLPARHKPVHVSIFSSHVPHSSHETLHIAPYVLRKVMHCRQGLVHLRTVDGGTSVFTGSACSSHFNWTASR